MNFELSHMNFSNYDFSFWVNFKNSEVLNAGTVLSDFEALAICLKSVAISKLAVAKSGIDWPKLYASG